MATIVETRRTGSCERAPKVSLGGDISEDTATLLARQAAHVAARFTVGPALAHVIAEHAFARRPLR